MSRPNNYKYKSTNISLSLDTEKSSERKIICKFSLNNFCKISLFSFIVIYSTSEYLILIFENIKLLFNFK